MEKWNYQLGQGDLDKKNHMVLYLIEGMKKCIVKQSVMERSRRLFRNGGGSTSENLPTLNLPLLMDDLRWASISSVSLLLIPGESCKNFNMAPSPWWLKCWIQPVTMIIRQRRIKGLSVRPGRPGGRRKW